MAAFTAPGWERTSYPATSPRPPLGRSRPVSILMVVVLPAPLGPRNPKISPRCTPNVTPSTAVKVPNRLVSLSTSMTGAPSRIAGARCRPSRFSRRGRTRDFLGAGHQGNKDVLQRGLALGRRAGEQRGGEFRVRRGQDAPAGHEGHARAPFRFIQIRGGDQHRHALIPGQSGDDLPEVPPRQRIHAGRRLVQQEHVREMDERTGQAELLPHAAGEVPRQAVRRRSQAGDLQEGGPVFAESVFGHAAQFGKEAQVLVHGQVVVEVEPQALRHVPDARLDALRIAQDVDAGHEGATAGGQQHAGQDLDDRALARAVRPQQPEDFAGINGEGGVAHGLHPPVALGEPRHFDDGCGGGHQRGSPFPKIWASARIPGLSTPSGFSTASFTAKTCLTRSSFVCTSLGVNSARWLISVTFAANARPGNASTETRASAPSRNLPMSGSGINTFSQRVCRSTTTTSGVPAGTTSPGLTTLLTTTPEAGAYTRASSSAVRSSSRAATAAFACARAVSSPARAIST